MLVAKRKKPLSNSHFTLFSNCQSMILLPFKYYNKLVKQIKLINLRCTLPFQASFFLQLRSGPDYLRLPMRCEELKKQDCYWKECELFVGLGDRYMSLQAHASHSINPNSSQVKERPVSGYCAQQTDPAGKMGY